MSRSVRALSRIDVSAIKGVGAKRSESLRAVGIDNVWDLITYYPRRYIDRTKQRAVADMELGEEAVVVARVTRVHSRRTRQGGALVEAELSDGTGRFRCTFFNQRWRLNQLRAGRQVVVFGRLDLYRGRRQMSNPVVDLLGDRTGRIVSVYRQSEKAGLSTWELGDWIEDALRRGGELADPLPPWLRERLGLAGRTWAFNAVHRPGTMADAQTARRRLSFDELLRMQVALVVRKRLDERNAVGVAHDVESARRGLLGRFLDGLAFELTGAQRRAIDEIEADLARHHPMHRLLQGDVGSGKTVVALAAVLVAISGGHQGAFMAPTEVLAEQHFVALREMLQGLEVPDEATLGGMRAVVVGLLTSRTTANERKRLSDGLLQGGVDVVVGTHALLGEEVAFASLGVVVIDEQHRFGVEQRATLRAKGRSSGGADPDLLVMTATPIPRTAAMTVFGDLDVTVLDEMPRGRTPVETVWTRAPLGEEAAWQKVRDEVCAGRQAYVVCPLVEESGRIEARSATEEFARLRAGPLEGLEVGLLHGQLRPSDKESVMARYRKGELGVLVATTVIEVGVDVPNATVMVIEDAARFGMAQLHQLRGRVGRGGLPAWCYLTGEATTGESLARIEALERTGDGFELAEVDLDLRGEGTIMGTAQKGANDLKLASLRRDRDLVIEARKAAFEIVDADITLEGCPELKDEVALLVAGEEAEYLFKS